MNHCFNTGVCVLLMGLFLSHDPSPLVCLFAFSVLCFSFLACLFVSWFRGFCVFVFSFLRFLLFRFFACSFRLGWLCGFRVWFVLAVFFGLRDIVVCGGPCGVGREGTHARPSCGKESHVG